jgi:D,D-heptose 1,7-bisphosphate phosphatase
MQRRALFLDRDGIINAMVYQPDFGLVDSPARPEEFTLLPGVATAVRRIRALGFLAIVISNQPGIAKGKFTPALLDAMTAKMHAGLAAGGAHLDAVYYCLHHPQAALPEYRARCDCRKPRPGLLRQAARAWEIDLARSFFVGDGVTDVVAGRAAGCTTVLVNSRKCYLCDELARQNAAPDYLVKDLATAVDLLELLENDDAAGAANFRFRCAL